MSILLRADLLIDGSGGMSRDAEVEIHEGRIVRAGERLNAVATSVQDVTDYPGCAILPGLIDCHVHLTLSGTMNVMATYVAESDYDHLIRAVANMRSALTAGITTVRDCGGRPGIVPALARAVAQGMLPGPRIVSCGAPITTTAGHAHFMNLEAEGVDAVRTAVRRMHKEGASFIKVMVTGGGSTPGTNMAASQYSPEELAAIADDAHRLGKRIAGHCHGTQGIRLAVRAGFDTIEHASWMSRDGNDYDTATVREMRERGTFVCRTVTGSERVLTGGPPVDDARRQAFGLLRRMYEDGLTLIAGTDAGVDQTPFDGLAASLETMVLLGGMSPSDAIASATSLAARALGLDDTIGTIVSGATADCIVVEGNPLRDIQALSRVVAVYKEGVLQTASPGVLIA